METFQPAQNGLLATAMKTEMNQEKEGMQGVPSSSRTPAQCVFTHNWRILGPRWTDRSDYTYWIQCGDGTESRRVFLLCICLLSELIPNVDQERRRQNHKYFRYASHIAILL